MDNRGRRGRRNRYTIHHTAPASTFGVRGVMATIVVVCLACSMLQYNCRNNQAKRELLMLANSVDDIAKQLDVIQNSYQLLEDKFAICSQELPKLEKQMAAFKTLPQVMEAHRFGWNPKILPGLPYIDVKLIDSKKPYQKIPIKNTTKGQNI